MKIVVHLRVPAADRTNGQHIHMFPVFKGAASIMTLVMRNCPTGKYSAMDVNWSRLRLALFLCNPSISSPAPLTLGWHQWTLDACQGRQLC